MASGVLCELATSRVAFHTGSSLLSPTLSSFTPEHNTVLPIMSYGKKDEDADTGLVKIDRTQVFQEGEQPAVRMDMAVALYTQAGTAS